jgi:hypothetical protein
MRSFLSVLLPVSIALFGCNQPPPSQPAATTSSAAPTPSPVERGRMLVIGGACHDCHTPKKMTPTGPQPDMTRMLSGHPESDKITAPFKPQGSWTAATNDHLTAWGGPWGVSFAANLTPDQNTGMGIWTEEMFVMALKSGKHMGTSRAILPPMPWPWYGQLSDDDLKAIFAYLRSIPPISNHVPPPLGPDGKPIG